MSWTPRKRVFFCYFSNCSFQTFFLLFLSKFETLVVHYSMLCERQPGSADVAGWGQHMASRAPTTGHSPGTTPECPRQGFPHQTDGSGCFIGAYLHSLFLWRAKAMHARLPGFCSNVGATPGPIPVSRMVSGPQNRTVPVLVQRLVLSIATLPAGTAAHGGGSYTGGMEKVFHCHF